MSVNETLRQVVEEAKETSDYSKIRDRLWARIATDLSLSGDFKEALDFCIKSGIREADLYEGHDGRDVDLESSEENLSSLIGALRTNFSKERLEAVRKMGGKLHPKQGSSTPSQAPDKAKSSSNSIKRYSVQKEGGSSSQEDGRSGRLVLGIVVVVVVAIIAGAILLKKL